MCGSLCGVCLCISFYIRGEESVNFMIIPLTHYLYKCVCVCVCVCMCLCVVQGAKCFILEMYGLVSIENTLKSSSFGHGGLARGDRGTEGRAVGSGMISPISLPKTFFCVCVCAHLCVCVCVYVCDVLDSQEQFFFVF